LILRIPITFAISAALLASCLVSERTEYPNGETRPNGGGKVVTGSGGGQGGSGGVGGMGGGPTCDCEDDLNSCTIEECSDAGVCVHKPDPTLIGTECNDDPTRACDDNGVCLLIDGQACVLADVCKSHVCVDSVCCESTCEGVCHACNVPGSEGKCANLPDGSADACPDDKGCFDGECAAGKVLGQACTTDPECVNNTCAGRLCRLPNNSSCSDPVQCASNFCDSQKLCAVPTKETDCRSGKMVGNICAAAPGEPCDADIPCVAGGCTPKSICGAPPGTLCESGAECSTQFCANKCAACTIAGCASCKLGICIEPNFPDGAYCLDDSYCAADLVCKGFPPKCQTP